MKRWTAAPDVSRAWVPGPPIRATDRDRDTAIGVIQTSYTVGRLSREEHDARVSQALSAQTYPELDRLTADLPERQGYPDAPVMPSVIAPRHVNGLAVASLVCGLAQPFTGMLTTIPAIVLGHVARSQVRRDGDDGSAMATWGLILGWAGLAAVIMLILAIVAFAFLISGSGT
jgi:Domain of unknown function (DUF4190)/Domain of unknown function (DUF1707)